MDINQKRKDILELCSESEYGSWEFWSDKDNKTKEECTQIIQAITDLVDGNKIIPTVHKFVKDQTYKEVTLDKQRLKMEINRSFKSNVDSKNFYWFYATEEGKKEDLESRRNDDDKR